MSIVNKHESFSTEIIAKICTTVKLLSTVRLDSGTLDGKTIRSSSPDNNVLQVFTITKYI